MKKLMCNDEAQLDEAIAELKASIVMLDLINEVLQVLIEEGQELSPEAKSSANG